MLPNIGSNSGLKWLEAYNTADAPFFPFRLIDTTAIIGELFTKHLVILHGDQSSGKTSFIQAQLIPALILSGAHVTLIRSVCDPIEEIKSDLFNVPVYRLSPEQNKADLGQWIDQHFHQPDRDLVIILDPCENILFSKGPRVSSHLFGFLAGIIQSQAKTGRVNLHVVLSIRSDFLPDLDQFKHVLPLLENASFYLVDHLNSTEIESFFDIFSRITNIHLTPELQKHIIDSSQQLRLRTVDIQLLLCFIYEEMLKAYGTSVGSIYIEVTYDLFLHLGNIPDITRNFLNKSVEETLEFLRQTNRFKKHTAGQLPGSSPVIRFDALLRRCLRLVMISFLANQRMTSVSSSRAILYQVLKDQSGIPRKWIALTLVALVRQGLIRRTPENPELLELVSAGLTAPISNWIDSSIDIQSLMDAQFKFSHIFAECVAFQRLMTIDELNEINPSADRLGLSTQALRLIFNSSLANAHQTKSWFDRLQNEFIPIIDLVNQEKLRSNYKDRVLLVKGIFNIGLDTLSELYSFLSDEYPQVRAHAIAALENLDGSGLWRQYLSREAYIPAGSFLMGINRGNFADEGPQHPLQLDAFYISTTTTTHAEYKRYMDDIEEPFDITPGMERHPITNLTWYQIHEYNRWASLRLPYEPEWEKAASWDEKTGTKNLYPWGNRFDETRCNMRAAKLNTTTPVGRYSPSGDSAYGCKDMAGNIWEWTNSIFLPYPYEKLDGRQHKATPGSRVIRGGSYECGASYVTCTVRLAFDPYSMRPDLGFRAVLDIPDVNTW